MLVPFTILPVFGNFFFPFITSKAFLFRILVEIIFFLFVILAVRLPEYRPRVSALLFAVSAFLITIFISALIGEDFSRSFWSNYERMMGVIAYFHFFLFFVVVGSFLRSTRRWHAFFSIWLGVSLVVAFQGFQEIGQLARIDSVLGNPIYLAGYAMLNVLLAGYLIENAFQKHFSPFLGWFYGFAGFVNLVALFFTGTRGSILALLGGIFLCALLIALFERRRVLFRKTAILLCLLFLALPLFFFALKDTAFIQNNGTLSRFTNISIQEGTGGARLELWQMSLRAFSEHPFFGYGMGNFGLVFADYYSPEMYAEEAWFDRAHSTIFNFLVVIGAIGLLTYIGIFLAGLLSLWYLPWLRERVGRFFPSATKDSRGVVKRFLHALKQHDNEKFSLVGKSILTGLLATYFVHLLFVFGDTVSLILFFAILAFIHSRVSKNRESVFGKNQVQKNTQIIFGVIAGVLLLGSLYFVNYLPMRQNMILSHTFKSTPEESFVLFDKALAYQTFGDRETREQFILTALESDLPKKTESELYQRALQEARANVEERPDDPRPKYFLTLLYTSFDKYQNALRSANEALILSTKKQQFLELKIQILYHLGRYDEALETAFKNYRLLEENDRAANLYATSLIYLKKEDQAQDFLKARYKTTIIPDAMFINAYNAIEDYEMVTKLWNARVKENPDEITYRFKLAASYLKLGKKEEAIDVYEAVILKWPKYKEVLQKNIEKIRTAS